VIERLHDEIAQLKRRARTIRCRHSATEVPAERAYRDHVAGIAKLLNERQIAAARAVLKDILGEIPVRPDDTGNFLVAEMKIQATPLMRAAGVGRNGSEGAILFEYPDEPLTLDT
jgi:hypothetical protein